MKNIVSLENRELVVSIKDISKFAGIDYESVKKLVKNKREDLESFRLLGNFKDSDLKYDSLKLSEPQATLIIISLKASEKVNKFRLDLVTQFYQMREQVCEINKLAVETLELELIEAKEMKTYKDGYMSLRKFIKKNGKFMKESEAWDLLVEDGYVKNIYPEVIKRKLLDTTIGRQKKGEAPVFNPSELRDIFSEYI